jgi:hypothetical protein
VVPEGVDDPTGERLALPADELRPVAAAAAGHAEEVLPKHGHA